MPYLSPAISPQFNPQGYVYQDPSTKPSMMLPLPMVFEDAAPPKWEYHSIILDPREEPPLDEAQLNQLGQEGWLLAGIIGIPAGDRVTRIAYYFVRGV